MKANDQVKWWWSIATIGFLISMLGALGVWYGFVGLGMIGLFLGWFLVIASIVMERVLVLLDKEEHSAKKKDTNDAGGG